MGSETLPKRLTPCTNCTRSKEEKGQKCEHFWNSDADRRGTRSNTRKKLSEKNTKKNKNGERGGTRKRKRKRNVNDTDDDEDVVSVALDVNREMVSFAIERASEAKAGANDTKSILDAVDVVLGDMRDCRPIYREIFKERRIF